MKSYVDEYLKGLVEERNNHFIQGCRYKQIEPKVHELQKLWTADNPNRTSSVTIALGIGTIGCMSLNLSLEENDGFQDICCQSILDSLENDPLFEHVGLERIKI